MTSKASIFAENRDESGIFAGTVLSNVSSLKRENLNFRPTISDRNNTIDLFAREAGCPSNYPMGAPTPTKDVMDWSAKLGIDRAKRGSEPEYLEENWPPRQSLNQATFTPRWLSDFDHRVAELRDAAAEDSIPFSEDSVRAARTFCERHGGSVRPSIFLVGNGNVRLVWENDDGEQIGLQFRADLAKVQCILFKRREDGISTITAMETNVGLTALLAGNRLLHLLGKR